MYKLYIVPDATSLSNHSDLYNARQLVWDPYTESDAYAVIDGQWKGELNKADSMEFTILPSNAHYNDFHKRKTVVLLYDDDDLLFEGVVADAPADFYKQRKVTCSGVLTYLCDSIQAPDEKNVIEIPSSDHDNSYLTVPDVWLETANPNALNWYERSLVDDSYVYTETSDQVPNANKQYYYRSVGDGENHSGTTITKSAATSETIADHIERLLSVHNSQVDAFKKIHKGQIIGDTTKHDFKSSNYRTTWDALKSDIIDDYGRYFRISVGNDNNLYLDYLEIWDMAPSATAPVIEYANNMMEMKEADDSDDDIFTILVPLGKDNLTLAKISDHSSPEYGDGRLVDPYVATFDGNKRYIVVSNAAIDLYGHIVKTQSFSDVSKVDELYTRAERYIKNNFDEHTEYDVKAIDLHILNGTSPRIKVGNRCTLKSTWHGVDERSLYTISAERDLVNPENDSFKIGIPTSDREAMNRTLTGQTNNSSSKQSSDAASASSGISRLNSILEEYIHVTEWGLEMSSKLKNIVESNDEKYMTKFIQDEDYINIAAQKMFGYDEDGVGDVDSGYFKVLKSDYKDSKGAYKNPSALRWFEKQSNGTYVLSNDTTCDPAVVGNKDYYIQRLWSRYSSIDVGPGGIKATVDGNYQRSTYCSSWINVNEESILALTGAIYVDENGQVIIKSGAGFRTGHTETKSEMRYIQVRTVMYSQNPNPAEKQWYEQKLDSSNHWLGQNQADAMYNDNYFVRTTDTTVNRSKYYYYKSDVREEYHADYGVYDENNLRAGILTTMINHPTYQKVSLSEKNNAKIRNESPNSKGWYVVDETTGNMGLTLDTEVSIATDYYTRTNNSVGYTEIRGEHIVVGATDDYDGMDAATQARVDKYIRDNNLNGTITEIASDVVVVNTLIAKYIDADKITANTSLWADHVYGNVITAHQHISAVDYITAPEFYMYDGNDRLPNDGDSIKHGLISTTSRSDGHGGQEDSGSTLNSSVTGDDVEIWFVTRDGIKRSTTFTKPASLGSVTWSSGSKTLTAKTVGGRDFLVGLIGTFQPSGQSEAAAMENAGYLATETSGYSTVYGIYYTRKDSNNNDVSDKTMLFKTPKNRYPDAESTIRTYSNWSKGDDEEIVLGYGGSANVYAQYKTESQFDAGSGNTNKNGVTVKAPSKGEFRTYAVYNDTTYTSGTIDFGTSGGSVTVYGQRKMDGDSDYESATGITVSASSSEIGDIQIFKGNSQVTTLSISLNANPITLTPYVVFDGSWVEGESCVVSAPQKAECTMVYEGSGEEGEGDNKKTYYYFKTLNRITSDKTMYY